MSAEQSKRSCDDMEVDQEIEDAIFEELSKKQCNDQEQSVEEQFADALSNVQERAAIDRQKLVKKACDHYVSRNGCSPSVDELESIFEDLADKFDVEPKDDGSSSSESESENDSEAEDDMSSINAKNMTDNLMSQLNDALDHAHDLAKKDKAKLTKSVQQKWQELNGSEITAEETEAVFAVIGKMFKDGPSSVSPGDADEEDADYELTEQDKQIEKEDAEQEEEEGEEEQQNFLCLDGELEFTSPTAFQETSEAEEEDQTIEYQTTFEVDEKLVEAFKKACPEATEEDITDVLTKSLADAEFDDEDEEYQPESEKEEDEESVYEEVDEEQTADPKFLDLEFGQDDGEDYGFDDFATDHQDEQDSDEYSDSEADDEEPAESSSSKSRPTGSVEKIDESLQTKHAETAAMDIEQTGSQIVA